MIIRPLLKMEMCSIVQTAQACSHAAELSVICSSPHLPTQMNPIPVKSHPFRQTFDSFEHAVRHAMNHPLRPKAEADTDRLLETTLVDSYWSFNEFVLGFSNGQWLHIFVSESEVRWQLQDSQPLLFTEPQFRIGAQPIQLDWKGAIGIQPMDPSDLVAKRIGAEVSQLFINDTGFFVYFRNHLVFEFYAAYRTDTGEDILYIIEDD